MLKCFFIKLIACRVFFALLMVLFTWSFQDNLLSNCTPSTLIVGFEVISRYKIICHRHLWCYEPCALVYNMQLAFKTLNFQLLNHKCLQIYFAKVLLTKFRHIQGQTGLVLLIGKIPASWRCLEYKLSAKWFSDWTK